MLATTTVTAVPSRIKDQGACMEPKLDAAEVLRARDLQHEALAWEMLQDMLES